MLDRMVKSARFNRDTFLAVKEDSSATGQALIVLALAGASFGVGFAASIGFSTLGILLGAVLGAVVSIALGIIWVSLTFLRSEEHTSELQSLTNLVCRLLLEKKNKKTEYI